MSTIKVDYEKCYGCRACEAACSLKHLENGYNPKRSRIRVFAVGNSYIPVAAGPYTDAECTSKRTLVINGAEISECAICRASCPSKPIFKEPDLDIPLKCDFCGDPPDPECCKVCVSGALTFVEDTE